jgi:hypothetical protein
MRALQLSLKILLSVHFRYEEFFQLEFFLKRAETIFAAADDGMACISASS